MEAVSRLLVKRLDEGADKNIGSARGTSTSAFVSTLVVNLIVFAVLVLIFAVLRRSNRRIYAPRTYVGTVEKWRRLRVRDDNGDGYADEVEGVSGFSGLIGWAKGVWTIPDETVLRTNGLDGYFFLRYLRKAQLICFVGCLLTWPVLFPINATGAGQKTGLDLLGFSNVNDPTNSDNSNRFYAHVFISWLFYGFVLFTIYRELIFFTTMRQAYMLSPIYSSRISARTLLVQTIPAPYLTESALRRIFDNVKRVWISTDTGSLDDLVEERDKIAMQLEAAEVKLIRMADKERSKQGGAAAATDSEPKAAADRPGTEAEGESGSVAARWLPRAKRPTHRLMPLIGEKVDTIDWCRSKLAELNPRIDEMQAAERAGEGQKLNSVFIEFTSQSAAQVALQTLVHHKPLHMAPRYIGLTPAEIVWSNMRLQWWERLVKFAATTAFVVVLVIFWSIPVAVVGIISQINFLVDKVPFLAFITDIPEAILGLITGLLPVVMLAVLMALLPIILRLMARISGLPSLSLIELRVQNSYFLFQVIQVFLITTMTSAASAVVTKIIDDPSSAPGLLAESLPAAANFYISFLILQGLSISAGALAQAAGLVLHKLLGMLLDNTPRKLFRRWSSLTGIGWGTVFPVYTNLCVIALTYSIIAPIVLGFAAVAFGLLYFAYRYNFLFVYNIDINTNGMVYPRALYQSLTGVYLGQVCLVGLFGVSKAPGPAILQLVFLVATILFQLTLSSAVQPLLEFLPKNLQAEEEALLSVENGADDDNGHGQKAAAGAAGSAGAGSGGKDGYGEEAHAPADAGLIARFLHPERYEGYQQMRKRIPQDFPEIYYTPETERDAYYNPSITARPPAIWVPRDSAGISAQEVAHTNSVNPCSDQGALLTPEGKLVRLDDAFPPDYTEKPLW